MHGSVLVFARKRAVVLVRVTFRKDKCTSAFWIYGPCLEKSPGAQIGSTGYSSAPGVQKFDSTWSGDIALEIFVGAIPCSRCFCELVVL